MTVVSIEKVGLASHFSEQGKWAFDLAFRVARRGGHQLNIFHFAESPYDAPLDIEPSEVHVREMSEQERMALDLEVREYYEPYLDDYEEVGFRVCETGRHNQELHRCLMHKAYQLLVIPYLHYGMSFGNMRIEEFAYRFVAPVVLVGPKRREEFHLNPPAALIHFNLDLPTESWKPIREPRKLQDHHVI